MQSDAQFQRDEFQSTHLLRGGTEFLLHRFFLFHISIHPPPARWDYDPGGFRVNYIYFNPPTSCEVGLAVQILSI